jgi:branched-chain amino acid transport system ATP-binding protein
MLTLNNLCVDIAGNGVLRGIHAELAPGASYAVVGRNGAGKTTLLRAIMGFAPVRSGSVTLGGADLLPELPHTRAAHGVGYAPEERVLFPTMTVLENLRLPCESIGLGSAQIDQRVREAVTAIPLIEPMLARSAAALSGGQGKIAALARALMVGTTVLLLDEPFQGLAPTLARQYALALSQLHDLRPGLCVVITESNRALLDRVDCITLTLERGELTALR